MAGELLEVVNRRGYPRMVFSVATTNADALLSWGSIIKKSGIEPQ
jgi:hypothetical protein